MKVLVAGATGLVGGRAIDALIDGGHEACAVGRRPLGREGVVDCIVDFSALDELPAADAAVCALGTTRADAGSAAAFRAVDHDAVLAFAEAARRAGLARFVLVTSVGADPRAFALYPRVKGEVEAAVAGLGFERLDILQPGLLLGPRSAHRPVEALLQRAAPWLSPLLRGGLARYGAIEADLVAHAAANLLSVSGDGVRRYENDALRMLAVGRAGSEAQGER